MVPVGLSKVAVVADPTPAVGRVNVQLRLAVHDTPIDPVLPPIKIWSARAGADSNSSVPTANKLDNSTPFFIFPSGNYSYLIYIPGKLDFRAMPKTFLPGDS